MQGMGAPMSCCCWGEDLGPSSSEPRWLKICRTREKEDEGLATMRLGCLKLGLVWASLTLIAACFQDWDSKRPASLTRVFAQVFKPFPKGPPAQEMQTRNKADRSLTSIGPYGSKKHKTQPDMSLPTLPETGLVVHRV